MKLIRKNEKSGYIKDFENSNDDLAFLLWQAELNKELLAFWKSITKIK